MKVENVFNSKIRNQSKLQWKRDFYDQNKNLEDKLREFNYRMREKSMK